MTNENSLRLVGYCRVSTTDQQPIEKQTIAIGKYCEAMEHSLVDVFFDKVSGKTIDRDGFKSCLHLLEKGEADGIIVHSLDRISRSLSDFSFLINTYFNKYQLVSVKDSVDTTSASGRLVLNMLITIAQWERETISERTRESMRYLRSIGRFTGGKLAYGFKQGVCRDGKPSGWIVPHNKERYKLFLMQKWRADGMSYYGIANKLNDLGFLSRNGKLWSQGKIHSIFKTAKKNDLKIVGITEEDVLAFRAEEKKHLEENAITRLKIKIEDQVDKLEILDGYIPEVLKIRDEFDDQGK